MNQAVNDNLILIGGKSAAGKSASLAGLNNAPNPEGVLYLNCEAGKKLPFRSKFVEKTITDPLQVYEAFDYAYGHADRFHTIVVDTLTYLLDMYESQYVIPAADGQKAWNSFQQYYKNLMQVYVARAPQNVVFLAHTLDTYNGTEMVMETKVPVKGSLKNNGIESYFSCVLAAKKIRIKDLEPYQSSLLNITPDEQALGFKYVFQTKLTKDTVNERLRGPMGLFGHNETYIDNNVQQVIDRLHQYYA